MVDIVGFSVEYVSVARERSWFVCWIRMQHRCAAYRDMIHDATVFWEYRAGRGHVEVERVLKSLYSA